MTYGQNFIIAFGTCKRYLHIHMLSGNAGVAGKCQVKENEILQMRDQNARWKILDQPSFLQKHCLYPVYAAIIAEISTTTHTTPLSPNFIKIASQTRQ